MLSDHALSTSGVGCQSRYLIEGLAKKGNWSVRQFGAAIKHANYNVIKVTDDFIIKPVDGFGSPDLLRQTLAVERPDVLLLFTDPRFFIWVWEMEDEIHQICPIAYWHVWDNLPVPTFNKVLYESTDLINCHSHLTYNFVKDIAPGKTNFIPHALPQEVFFPIQNKEEIKKHKKHKKDDKKDGKRDNKRDGKKDGKKDGRKRERDDDLPNNASKSEMNPLEIAKLLSNKTAVQATSSGGAVVMSWRGNRELQ